MKRYTQETVFHDPARPNAKKPHVFATQQPHHQDLLGKLLLKCDRIERRIETICEEIPSLENVANAFRELLLERTRLKEEIPLLAEGPVFSFDPVRFRQGVPLLSVEALIALAASCDNAVYRLLPAMYKGFPKIASELRKFESSVENGLIEPKQCMTATFDNRAEEMARTASTISMEPRTLKFILAQLFKPYIEKRARAFGSHIKDLPWTKSYCPICGSLPELGFLKGDAGEMADVLSLRSSMALPTNHVPLL